VNCGMVKSLSQNELRRPDVEWAFVYNAYNAMDEGPTMAAVEALYRGLANQRKANRRSTRLPEIAHDAIKDPILDGVLCPDLPLVEERLAAVLEIKPYAGARGPGYPRTQGADRVCPLRSTVRPAHAHVRAVCTRRHDMYAG
jgi:hypothetical protein